MALFGWHAFHRIDAPTLSAGTATIRLAAAGGYILLCMLSIAAIAFTLGLALPRGAEALAVAVGFVIGASMLGGTHALSGLQRILPVHYWQDRAGLFDPAGAPHLATGAAVQLATVALCTGAAALVLTRRDPAA